MKSEKCLLETAEPNIMTNIIAVIPVDPKDRQNIEYVPQPSMIHIPCERCEIVCWIGPKQIEMKKNNLEFPILCMLCLLKQCQEWQETGEEIEYSIKPLGE